MNRNNSKKNKVYYEKHNKFKVAFDGLIIVFKEENSLKFQSFILLLVFIAGLLFKINLNQWLAIIIISTIVICLEVVNTAIENIVDLVCPEYSIKAKKIKDISAGAVLFSVIGAMMIGMIIFIPKLVEFLN